MDSSMSGSEAGLTERQPSVFQKTTEVYESLYQDFNSKVSTYELEDVEWILGNKVHELKSDQHEKLQLRLYAISLSKNSNLANEIQESIALYKECNKIDTSSWYPAKEKEAKSDWTGKVQSRDFEINFAKNYFVISLPSQVKIEIEERKIGPTVIRGAISYSATFSKVAEMKEVTPFIAAITSFVKALFPASVPVYRLCGDTTKSMYVSKVGGTQLGRELFHALRGEPLVYENKLVPYLLWVGNEKERRRVFNKPALTLTYLESQASTLGLEEYSKKLAVFLGHLIARSKERVNLSFLSNAFMRQQKPLKEKVLFSQWAKQEDKSKDHIKIPKPREFASVLTESEKFVPLVSKRPHSITKTVSLVTAKVNLAGRSFDKGSYPDSLGFLQAARKHLEESVTVRGVDISPILRARLKAWRQVKNAKKQRTGDQKSTCTLQEVMAEQRLLSPYNPLYIAYAVSTNTFLLDNRQNVIKCPWIAKIERDRTVLTREGMRALEDIYAESIESIKDDWAFWGPDDVQDDY